MDKYVSIAIISFFAVASVRPLGKSVLKKRNGCGIMITPPS